MKNLIKGESIRFDIHDSGSGQEVNSDRDLHMHKIMNKDRYNGAEVLIPVKGDRELEIRKIKGNSRKVRNQIINEINNALKKDKKKRIRFVNDVISQIDRYSEDLPIEEKVEYLKKGLSNIIKHFNLKNHILDEIKIIRDEKLNSLVTSHETEDNSLAYIEQDIKNRRLKVGDDLKELLIGNRKKGPNYNRKGRKKPK